MIRNTWIALSTALLAAMLGRAQDADTAVVVTVLSSAVIDDSLVTIGRVAEIKGGSASLRYKIAKLDLADFKLGESRRSISAEQIRFRMLVAGIDESRFRLAGARTVTLTENAEPIAPRQFLKAAESALRQAYDPAHTIFNAIGSVSVPTLRIDPDDVVRLEGKITEPAPANGLVKVNVSIFVNQKVQGVVPVQFEVAAAPSAPKRLDASLQQASMTAAPAKDLRTVVIKQRDPVKIVAKIGSARIEAGGEAMQEGRVGDLIRVKNLESNRIVFGRVDESGAVIVDY